MSFRNSLQAQKSFPDDIAERLRTLAAGGPPWPAIDVERAVPWLEARGGLTFSPSQREALRLAAASKALVITGGPGVGKPASGPPITSRADLADLI